MGKTVEQLFHLTAPVAGAFHVEEGKLCVELRSGFAYYNGPYLFTAGPRAAAGVLTRSRTSAVASASRTI